MTGAIAVDHRRHHFSGGASTPASSNPRTPRSRPGSKIKRLAMHDVLTGLANRMSFRQALQEAMDRAGHQERSSPC